MKYVRPPEFDERFEEAVDLNRVPTYYDGIWEDMQKEMGRLLAEARQHKLLTQEQLGQKIHCSASSISSVENNRGMIDLRRAFELCRFFDIHLWMLLREAFMTCLFQHHLHRGYRF